MKRFPFSRLTPTTAWITASLRYDPSRDLSPMVRHTITVNIEPIILGADAVMPEYENIIDSTIILSGLALDGLSWNSLSGTYTFDSIDQDGSFYVTSVHNPVTVNKLVLQYCGDTTYDVDATTTFHFEIEGSGYVEETSRLVFAAVHRGLVFFVPNRGTPDEWSPNVTRNFVERYFDLSHFTEITIEDGVFFAKPSVA